MKKLYLIVFIAVFSLSAHAEAGGSVKQLTSGESLEHCKNALRSKNAAKQYTFKRKVATRFKGGQFTHWINSTIAEAGKKATGKVKCIVSREGELVLLDEQPGRWTM